MPLQNLSKRDSYCRSSIAKEEPVFKRILSEKETAYLFLKERPHNMLMKSAKTPRACTLPLYNPYI